MIEYNRIFICVIYLIKHNIGSQCEGILLSSKFCLCASIVSEATFCGVSTPIILGNLLLTNKIEIFIGNDYYENILLL